MIKNIKIEDKEITLSNNTVWVMIYRNQFGHDIISTLTPVVASIADLIGGFFQGVEPNENGEIEFTEVAKKIDGDALIDAIAHLSGLEFVDILNITWSMAKAADSDIPDPMKWITELEVFPVDVIVPEVVMLATKGLTSTKKFKRLSQHLRKMKKARPSISIPSYSQESSGA